MDAADSDTPQIPRWGSVAKAAFVWLIGCFAAGYFTAAIIGWLVGLAIWVEATCIGIAGATLQTLLSRNQMFLRRSYFSQVLILVVGATVPLLFLFRAPPGSFDFVFMLSGIGFAILAACLGVMIIRSPWA